MEIKELEKILTLLKEYGVSQFEMEQDGVTIKLSRGIGNSDIEADLADSLLVERAVASVPSSAVSGKPSGGENIPDNWVRVTSPIVGTFYRKPSPDAEPFVNVGDIVKKGDTLCIVEAMKLMNEIESVESGRIEKILLSDGQVVEYGETLMLIDPSV